METEQSSMPFELISLYLLFTKELAAVTTVMTACGDSELYVALCTVILIFVLHPVIRWTCHVSHRPGENTTLTITNKNSALVSAITPRSNIK